MVVLLLDLVYIIYLYKIQDTRYLFTNSTLCTYNVSDNSTVNILKDPPQIATEGFSMVLRPEGFLLE